MTGPPDAVTGPPDAMDDPADAIEPTRAGGAPQAAARAVGCVVVAAGSGTRLGLGVPKALATAGSTTLLEVAVAAAAAADPSTGLPVVDHLVVVVPAGKVDPCAALVRGAWTGAGRTDPVVVVAGGADRQASVAAGLHALTLDATVVLVHDAARALTPASVFAAVAGAVRDPVVAVVPGLTPADTVKRLRPAGSLGAGSIGAESIGPLPRDTRTVADTLDRSLLVTVQTPQGFRADVLRELHRAPRRAPADDGAIREAPEDATGHAVAGASATDDAGLAEAAGYTVVVVPGHPEAFKVTTALDLLLARALLGQRSPGQDDARDS